MKSRPVLYLASQSPRRRDILTRMKVPFHVVPSNYREYLRQNTAPGALALEHAEGKARRAVVPAKARFVMGADTVVACAGRLLGKPANEKEALAMIRLLSGRTNEVVTGIALLDLKTGIMTRAAACSYVKIKKMNAAQQKAYVRNSHPYDKAGGYAIQGGPRIARRIRGSYSNIVGFPRELVRKLLKQAGFFLLVLGLLQSGTTAVRADILAGPERSEHTEASLIPETNGIAPGQKLRVALRLRMDEHWHTYWLNSGDSGLATTIRWTLPEGFEAGPIQWPWPQIIRQPPLATYGYENEIWLFSDIQAPAVIDSGQNIVLKARVNWLECEVPCLPGQARFSLDLPVVDDPAANPVWDKGAADFLNRLPLPAPEASVSAEQTQNRINVFFDLHRLGLPEEAALKQAYFFPDDSEWIEHAALQSLEKTSPGQYRLTLERSRLRPELLENLSGYLWIETGSVTQAYSVRTAPALSESSAPESPAVNPLPQNPGGLGLLAALIFAFLGGLILNLMPCVLPVLSLKLLSFASHRDEAAALRRHSLVWTLGVLVSFWILCVLMLALRWGGSSLGWGFHLQSPVIVTALLLIFLLLTLNLSGFFEIGLLLTRFSGPSGKGHKVSEAFFSGVLVVVAATPCTAPFMGAAIGYSLAQPLPVVLAVFSFLGLGMAFPFLALSFIPGGIRFLPRPGAWMNTLKKVLSVPLALTVLWLAWVLAVQIDGVSLAAVFGFAAFAGISAVVYGRTQTGRGAPWLRPVSLGLIIIFSAAALAGASRAAKPGFEKQPVKTEGVEWQTYSREALEAARSAGSPVFINFTARWCLSCQANDRLVFRSPKIGEAFKQRGIQAFKADWTLKDREITEALDSYGRASVPLYVYYHGQAQEPEIWPELLTIGFVLDQLKKD